jgi:transcriptional/translational regulatory protein YebC/TACO1
MDDKKKVDHNDDDGGDDEDFSVLIEEDNTDISDKKGKSAHIYADKSSEKDIENCMFTQENIYNIHKNMIKYVDDECLPLCDFLNTNSIMKFIESIIE